MCEFFKEFFLVTLVFVSYGRPLFGSVEDERFPLPVIIPQCLTEEGISEVTLENFGQQVKL